MVVVIFGVHDRIAFHVIHVTVVILLVTVVSRVLFA
jgi:hypothetical protein